MRISLHDEPRVTKHILCFTLPLVPGLAGSVMLDYPSGAPSAFKSANLDRKKRERAIVEVWLHNV